MNLQTTMKFSEPMVRGFVGNIEEETKRNHFFRKVLYTDRKVQLVVMCLKPGEDIGEEVHTSDQFIRVEDGKGWASLNGRKSSISEGVAIVVPNGTRHNVKNTSNIDELQLYTLYSPPVHRDGVIHRTKREAEMEEG